MKKIIKIFLSIILIEIIIGVNFKNYAIESKNDSHVSIAYNTHIQDKGWEKDFSKQNGETAGTTGKAKRLEAIEIKIE